jgi:predicted ferric reductase
MNHAPSTGPTRPKVPLPPRRGLHPPVLVCLFLVLALLPLAAAAWLSGIEPAGTLNELATALGLVAGALLCIQFLTSGRYESLSGRLGIDRTMGFHRIAALALLTCAVAHPVVYLLDTAIADPGAAWQRFSGLVSGQRTRTGVLALGGLAVLVGFAIWQGATSVRYEVWRASHGLLALVVVGFTLHHAITIGTYSAEPTVQWTWWLLALLAISAAMMVYIVRPWRMWRQPWHVERITSAGEAAWQLDLRGPDVGDFSFHPGQFVWITLEPNRPPFHDHPFSIASSPHELPTLRLLIRESGDCTRDFGRIKPGTRVAIDGPHGSFILSDETATILMLAGGVGIAPILGMLEHAASTGDRRKFRLIVAGRTPQAIPALARLGALQSRLDLTISAFVDAPTTEAGFKAGPINRTDIIAAIDDPGATTAYVCGPPGWMSTITFTLLEAGLPVRSIHYERFDYASGRGWIDRIRFRQDIAVLAVIAIAMIAFALR